MANVLIRMEELRRRLGGAGRSTVYDMIDGGLLPKPTRYGPRAVGWVEDRIDRLIAARIAGKSDAEIKALVAEMNAGRDREVAA